MSLPKTFSNSSNYSSENDRVDPSSRSAPLSIASELLLGGPRAPAAALWTFSRVGPLLVATGEGTTDSLNPLDQHRIGSLFATGNFSRCVEQTRLGMKIFEVDRKADQFTSWDIRAVWSKLL
jgi:hypothetical protein